MLCLIYMLPWESKVTSNFCHEWIVRDAEGFS